MLKFFASVSSCLIFGPLASANTSTLIGPQELIHQLRASGHNVRSAQVLPSKMLLSINGKSYVVDAEAEGPLFAWVLPAPPESGSPVPVPPDNSKK